MLGTERLVSGGTGDVDGMVEAWTGGHFLDGTYFWFRGAVRIALVASLGKTGPVKRLVRDSCLA